MQRIIIADVSCLILLDKINKLDLLKILFHTITITPEVASEFKNSLPVWIEFRNVGDKTLQLFIEKFVDKGEASAIALAKELRNSLLIIDRFKRKNICAKKPNSNNRHSRYNYRSKTCGHYSSNANTNANQRDKL